MATVVLHERKTIRAAWERSHSSQVQFSGTPEQLVDLKNAVVGWAKYAVMNGQGYYTGPGRPTHIARRRYNGRSKTF